MYGIVLYSTILYSVVYSVVDHVINCAYVVPSDRLRGQYLLRG